MTPWAVTLLPGMIVNRSLHGVQIVTVIWGCVVIQPQVHEGNLRCSQRDVSWKQSRETDKRLPQPLESLRMPAKDYKVQCE